MSVRAIVRPQSSEGQPILWPDAGEPLAPVPKPERDPQASLATSHEQPQTSQAALAEARQTGFREGEAAGRGKASAELRPVLERLAQATVEMAKLRPRLREQAEEDLVRLAVAIARRVVRRELTVDPQTITGLVSAALTQVASEEQVRLRVHPDHEAAMRAFLGAGPVHVIGDPSLACGSAIFETARGNLDASAESQLAEIERGLADRFRSAR